MGLRIGRPTSLLEAGDQATPPPAHRDVTSIPDHRPGLRQISIDLVTDGCPELGWNSIRASALNIGKMDDDIGDINTA
eukprot:13041171-Alexandrium_andersonii.AAC.1